MSIGSIHRSMVSHTTDSYEKIGAPQHLVNLMNFFKRECVDGVKDFIFLLGDIDLQYMIREGQDCNADILEVWHDYLYGKGNLDDPFVRGSTKEMIMVAVFEVLNGIKKLRWSDVKNNPVVEFRFINDLTLSHILKNSLQDKVSNSSKVSDIKIKDFGSVCLSEVDLDPLTKEEFMIIQKCEGLGDILNEVCSLKYNKKSFEGLDKPGDMEKVWNYSRKIAQHILNLAELVRECMSINNKKSFSSLDGSKICGSRVGMMCSSTDSIRFK